MRLEGQRTLVTGGSRSIGRGIALGMAHQGADVAVNFKASREDAEDAVRQMEEMGRRAIAVQGSTDSSSDVERFVGEAYDFLGGIDILVNNAGIASRGNSVADTDPAEFERVVKTHTFGTFYATREVIPHLRQRPRGDIVMISSAATRRWAGNGAPYNVGKAGLEALASGVAKEEMKNNMLHSCYKSHRSVTVIKKS